VGEELIKHVKLKDGRTKHYSQANHLVKTTTEVLLICQHQDWMLEE
jgi:hypothetical protein